MSLKARPRLSNSSPRFEPHSGFQVAPADFGGGCFQFTDGAEHRTPEQGVQSQEVEPDEDEAGQGQPQLIGPGRGFGPAHGQDQGQAAGNGAAFDLVAVKAGRPGFQRHGVFQDPVRASAVSAVHFLKCSGAKQSQGPGFEFIGPVVRVEGAEAGQPQLVHVLAGRILRQLFGDHGRAEFTVLPVVGVHQAGEPGFDPGRARAVFRGQHSAAVRNPLPGENDLPDQSPGLVKGLFPGLFPGLEPGPDKDQPQRRDDDGPDDEQKFPAEAQARLHNSFR